jgi:hypothetical protein
MNNQHSKIATLIVLFGLVGVSLFGQTTLSGIIKDNSTKEPIIGAVIKATGPVTKAVETDFDGAFSLSLTNGDYIVEIDMIGFDKITEKVIIDGTNIVKNFNLGENPEQLQAVEIVTQKLTNTDKAVVDEIKTIAHISTGISSQNITKLQDRDAAQVVRRIAGVSISDDRFIVIRGLNERYNTVLLNDIVTPSTEIDVKAFSFDLIPSQAIDRMLVYKSPASDLPGDLTGGGVKIYTKSQFDDPYTVLSVGSGIRFGTTNQTATVDRAMTIKDILGFGAQDRALKNAFPTTRDVLSSPKSGNIIGAFNELPAFYNIQNTTIAPDAKLGLSLGRKFKLGEQTIYNSTFFNYSRSTQLLNLTQNRFLYDASVQSLLLDESTNIGTRFSVMNNMYTRIGKTKIEFKNLYAQIQNNESIIRQGKLYENGLDVLNQSFKQEQKSILSSQLSGLFEVNKKLNVRTTLGLGYTLRNEPDNRRFSSSKAINTEGPYNIDLQIFESPTLQQAARFFSSLDEYVVSANTSVQYTIKDADHADNRIILLAGTYTEYKDRFFNARWFGLVNPNRLELSQTTVKPEEFFKSENVSSTRFYYAEGTNFDDKYYAQNFLQSGFAQIAFPVTSKISTIVGSRLEYNQQELQSKERGGGQSVSISNPQLSVLPSIISKFKFTDNAFVRASYATTINRPEFRELAPFTYYDFAFDISRKGNQNVKNATIHNFDIRYETYLGGSNMLTLGVFYKKFLNPIEASIFYNGSNISFTVVNSESATSYGLELDVRKEIIPNLTAMVNVSLIQSDVNISNDVTENRSLQGQSPYVVNTGLFYTLPKSDWQFNFLYNVIGKRIFVIGDNVLSATVYEMPRNVLDFNVSKTIGKWNIKLVAQDLLNQPINLIQDTNRDLKITNSDGIFQTTKRGTNLSLNLQYSF